mgnify:CR=1 FL=1
MFQTENSETGYVRIVDVMVDGDLMFVHDVVDEDDVGTVRTVLSYSSVDARRLAALLLEYAGRMDGGGP